MTTIENVEAQARELLSSRITSVRELVTARQRETDLRTQLAEAERETKKTYVRATKDGWSEDELKKLGLDNSAAGRRRQARKAETATGNTGPTEGSEA